MNSNRSLQTEDLNAKHDADDLFRKLDRSIASGRRVVDVAQYRIERARLQTLRDDSLIRRLRLIVEEGLRRSSPAHKRLFLQGED